MHVSHGRIQGQPSEQRTATFTGTVHVDPVMTAPDVMINTVIFTPGARTVSHGPTQWGAEVEPDDHAMS